MDGQQVDAILIEYDRLRNLRTIEGWLQMAKMRLQYPSLMPFFMEINEERL